MSDRPAKFTAFDCNYTDVGYQCSACGKTFDVQHGNEWHQKKVCLHCGAEEKMSDQELMSLEEINCYIEWPEGKKRLIETARAAHYWKAQAKEQGRNSVELFDECKSLQAENWDLRELVDSLRSDIDDPQFDATDFAHPAWWRGHEYTTKMFCKLVEKILDGKDDGRGIASDPWESVRRRLLELVKQHNESVETALAKIDALGE